MLDDLYVEIKKRVADLLVSWVKHGIVTLALDGWENVKKSKVVNFLCRSGGAAIFLDRVDTGAESQTAERQAAVAQKVMDAHGGADRFSAVATDSAESCIKMRASLAAKFPGLVPLGDQARIANLIFEDVLKVPWASAVVENGCFIGAFIRGRQTLLSHYRTKIIEFNKSKPDTARSALQFAKPSTTRFAFYFDVLDRGGRNKSVCQAMVNDDESFDSVSPARTADARQKKENLRAGAVKRVLEECQGAARRAGAADFVPTKVGLAHGEAT
jgi:hypothetical protein